VALLVDLPNLVIDLNSFGQESRASSEGSYQDQLHKSKVPVPTTKVKGVLKRWGATTSTERGVKQNYGIS
jgi:hypothetical protein